MIGATVSFIVGGSSGMGLETARLIANGGTFVLVGCDQAKLAARKRELEDGIAGTIAARRRNGSFPDGAELVKESFETAAGKVTAARKN